MVGGMWVALASMVGCESKPVSEPSYKANPAVRAAVNQPPVAPEKPSRFGYDAYNHLLPASSLVHGFEVPMGLSKPEMHRGFIDFELTAPMRKIREFYQGSEIQSGRRFSERRYVLEEGKIGFEVWHTSDTLDRLGLDRRFKRAHIFVTNHHNRIQRFRIHIPRDGGDKLAGEFVPNVDDEKRARLRKRTLEVASTGAPEAPEGRGEASKRDGGDPSDGSGGGGQAGSPADSGKQSSGRKTARKQKAGNTPEGGGGDAAEGAEDGPKAPAGAHAADIKRYHPSGRPSTARIPEDTEAIRRQVRERYGPYPPNRRNDVRPLIRQWQANNPGKTFLD